MRETAPETKPQTFSLEADNRTIYDAHALNLNYLEFTIHTTFEGIRARKMASLTLESVHCGISFPAGKYFVGDLTTAPITNNEKALILYFMSRLMQGKSVDWCIPDCRMFVANKNLMYHDEDDEGYHVINSFGVIPAKYIEEGGDIQWGIGRIVEFDKPFLVSEEIIPKAFRVGHLYIMHTPPEPEKEEEEEVKQPEEEEKEPVNCATFEGDSMLLEGQGSIHQINVFHGQCCGESVVTLTHRCKGTEEDKGLRDFLLPLTEDPGIWNIVLVGYPDLTPLSFLCELELNSLTVKGGDRTRVSGVKFGPNTTIESTKKKNKTDQ